MKKIIALLLSVVMLLGVTSVAAEEGIPYPADIEGHWAEGEIARAYMSGMVNGDPDGSFRPDDVVSRAEFLKMIVATFCERLDGFVPDELDDGTHWAAKYYNFANAMMYAPLAEDSAVDGIVPGLMSAENFDLPIGRWEMSYLVSESIRNVLGIVGRETSETYSDAEEIKAAFPVAVVDAITNTFFMGIITGDENGNINAKQGGTRAEAVVIVNRVDALLADIIKQAEATQQQQQQMEQQIAESVKVYEEIPEGHPVVTVEMENGKKFKIELYPEYAPQTVANFVELAKSGFYNGLTFHRIVEGFMAQGGDPEGTGMGGSEHNIKGEFAANGFAQNTLSHTRGVISMARSSHPDSASSQFFICYDDASFLDGSYAAFGKVIEGMEVVDDFLKVERTANAMGETAIPVEPVVIKTVTVSVGK